MSETSPPASSEVGTKRKKKQRLLNERHTEREREREAI